MASNVRAATVQTRTKASKLLDLMDTKYRAKLKGVSLVAELDIAHEEARKLALYTGVATSTFAMNERGRHISDCWPAAWVVAVAGLAVEGYQHGGFWPTLHAAMEGFIPGDDVPAALKQAYLDSLEQLRLPVTRDPGHQLYISNVVLHSGIPTYCLTDWFRMLSMAAYQVGDDPEPVMVWCRQRLETASLHFVDRPIRLMLEHGDEFALDLADRSLSAISLALDSNPTDLEDPAHFASAALPQRFTTALVDWVRRERTPTRRSGSRRRRRAVPQTALDVATGDVLLVLPAVIGADNSFRWWIRLDDGNPYPVEPELLWDGDIVGVDACVRPISTPARVINIEGHYDLSASVRLIDPARPVMAFDSSGRRLSPFAPLPSGRVWLVAPGKTLRSAAHAGHSLEPVAIADPPLGWVDWETACVDLDGLASVEFKDPSFTWHVSSQRSAEIVTDEPLDAVTLEGLPVHATRPFVNLPVDGEGAESAWLIEVVDLQTGSPVYSNEVVIGRDTSVDPWEKTEQPLSGLFSLVVRGPLGRGAKREVAVVEGLCYRSQPHIRMMRLEGLQKCTVTLSSPEFGESCTIELDERTAHMAVRLCHQTLRVYPAALAVADAGPDRLPSWSHAPAQIPVEDLHERVLMVRSLEGSDLHPWVTCRGVARQRLSPTSRRGAVQSFALDAVADTVATYGQARLELREPSDPDAAVVPLARVAPRELASGVQLVRDGTPTLQLLDYRPADVECFVWAEGAPWLPAYNARPSRSGDLALPAEWDRLGDLYVHCRLMDDWSPQPAPIWPSHRDFRVEGALLNLPGDARSRYILQPEGPPPPLSAEDAWKVLRFLEVTKSAVPTAVHGWLTGTLKSNVASALETLARLTADPSLTVGLLARADLLSAAGGVMDLDECVRIVRENTVVGALLASTSAIAADGAEVLLALQDSAGEAVGEILRGELDPYARGGAFTPQEERLESFPSEQIEALVRELRLVPRALLDLDSRTQAGITLFSARDTCRRLQRDTEVLIGETRCLLTAHGYERTAAALDCRRHPRDASGWLSLSAASLASALTARFAAHGDADAARLHARFSQWCYLPDGIRPLHAIDVVLAEAYAVTELASERAGR